MLSRTPLRAVACLFLFASCADRSPLDVPPGDVPVRPGARIVTAVAFDHRPAGLQLDVPPSSRPSGRAAPAAFGLVGPLELHETKGRTDVYRTPLPVLSNLMPTKLKGTHHFGSGAPPGFEVHGPARVLPFERNARGAGTYGFDRDYLYVGVAHGDPAPIAEDYFVKYPRATDTERARNRDTADVEDAAFALRTVTIDTESVHGLYLPAPGTASWSVDIPEDGVLTFRGTVLPPAIADTRASDGASVVVEVDGAPVGEAALGVDAWSAHRLDLSAWGGRSATVTFRSVPGATPTYDYVFLEGPTLYTPTDHPRRVILAFVDTLRPDHLGLYGYDAAPTSPTLDRWGAGAAVFEQARGVAPWTLPSARAALSGAQPEQWYEERPLSERFAAAGFHTEALVSNAFLSQPFDMHRGWTRFAYDHLQPADQIVDRAREVLETHADRDVLLLVHFMEPHLPYEEHWTYRWRFAGLRPWSLDSLTRHWLFELPPDHADLPAIRDHVVDRYDANIRVVDDQLLGLLTDAGPDATTVLFSDHGEEFWEHGTFEHGHAFWDELLRVPLVVRSPALPPGRHAAPVSLLDIAPTVLELEGLPSEVRHGASLAGLAWGDDGAAATFEARPQAFGRPLYGPDGWGVVADGHKWYGRGGERSAFDLQHDPAESTDVIATVDEAPFPDAMATSLEREVVLAWRVKIFQKPTATPVDLHVRHPAGLARAWSAYDPRGRAAGAAPTVDDDGVVHVRVPGGSEAPAAIYVVPAVGEETGPVDPLDCRGLEVRIRGRGLRLDGTCNRELDSLPPTRETLLRIGDKGWGATIDLEWAPLPAGVAVAGFADEMEQQLRELGYLDE